MNRQVLENLIIFSVTLSESINLGNGYIHPSYLDEKSKKYLGINISDYSTLSTNDFVRDLESGRCTRYMKPHEILENISHKIDINNLHNFSNIISDGTDWDGTERKRIAGLDGIRTEMALVIIQQLDDNYYTEILREYNINNILSE